MNQIKPTNTENNIVTDKLVLEPIVQSHAKKLFSDLQSPELFQYIPQNPPISLQKLEERYQKWSKRQSDDGNEVWLNYALKSKVVNKYVGTVQATIQSKNTVYIAYEIFPLYWRKGIGKEATKALISHLFQTYSITQVTAHIDTRNLPSRKLLESLKFELIEEIKNADEFKGSTSDEYVYLLKAPNY